MKRPPVGLAVLGILTFLLFSSCDQFFSLNLFQKAGLGQQKTPSAADLASMSVSDLENLADSPSFYTDLSDDSAKKNAVLDNLSAAYGDVSNSADEIQSAAALYAQVQLNTTDGQAVVNGVVSAALSTDLGSLDGTNIIDFLKASLPSDVLADSTGAKFRAAVSSLIDSKPAYDALGASIVANGGTTTLSPAAIGDAAQGAMLSYVLNGTSTSGGTGNTIDDLWNLVNGTGSASVSYSAPSGSDQTNVDAILTAAHSPFSF
ncbi:MAG TPA: hypothetical protein VMC79_14535 [Rectinemataceae bacterium]|nr:hypothetical protein [Rectinemataceae bacterium]